MAAIAPHGPENRVCVDSMGLIDPPAIGAARPFGSAMPTSRAILPDVAFAPVIEQDDGPDKVGPCSRGLATPAFAAPASAPLSDLLNISGGRLDQLGGDCFKHYRRSPGSMRPSQGSGSCAAVRRGWRLADHGALIFPVVQAVAPFMTIDDTEYALNQMEGRSAA
jgi:hypothetical protein